MRGIDLGHLGTWDAQGAGAGAKCHPLATDTIPCNVGIAGCCALRWVCSATGRARLHGRLQRGALGNQRLHGAVVGSGVCGRGLSVGWQRCWLVQACERCAGIGQAADTGNFWRGQRLLANRAQPLVHVLDHAQGVGSAIIECIAHATGHTAGAQAGVRFCGQVSRCCFHSGAAISLRLADGLARVQGQPCILYRLSGSLHLRSIRVLRALAHLLLNLIHWVGSISIALGAALIPLGQLNQRRWLRLGLLLKVNPAFILRLGVHQFQRLRWRLPCGRIKAAHDGHHGDAIFLRNVHAGHLRHGVGIQQLLQFIGPKALHALWRALIRNLTQQLIGLGPGLLWQSLQALRHAEGRRCLGLLYRLQAQAILGLRGLLRLHRRSGPPFVHGSSSHLGQRAIAWVQPQIFAGLAYWRP
ncbi:hypothetical protein [Comamonas aquatica]|uniref:hypothetical protein n=1 Tax=Comamonas aquatica TaxID=225991 RepID=UPI00391A3FCB